jgi:hypothetical protein
MSTLPKTAAYSRDDEFIVMSDMKARKFFRKFRKAAQSLQQVLKMPLLAWDADVKDWLNLWLKLTFAFTNPYSFRGVYDAAGFTMARKRTRIGKILVTAVVCLLLCAIVAGEFPELLSLTDNATNDFTVVRTNLSAFPVLVRARSRGPAAEINYSIPATTLLLSHPSSFQAAASILPKHSALDSVLRT